MHLFHAFREMSFKVPKKASYKYLEVNVTKCIAELTKATNYMESFKYEYAHRKVNAITNLLFVQ